MEENINENRFKAHPDNPWSRSDFHDYFREEIVGSEPILFSSWESVEVEGQMS